MYEKVKVQQAVQADEEEDCHFCNRPKLGVTCLNCLIFIAGVRARRECPDHPKVVNSMDQRCCTNCKSIELWEGDPVTNVVNNNPAAPAMVTEPNLAPPAVRSPVRAAPVIRASAPAVPIKTGIPAAVRAAAAAEPIQAPPDPDGPAPGCICLRHVNFLYCGDCAYVVTSGRKRMECPVHPENQEGLETCPSCNSNELEEG